jgi:3-hydroxyisobutyrate dehydrogenase-like beta-hydroxyacid dehydrogenase
MSEGMDAFGIIGLGNMGGNLAAQALEKGLRFVDLGTNGGVSGARNGACFMAGGDAEAITRIEPILKKLSVDGGYVHAGPAGAGHFTKLVHNGIEFGMLQAIGEGVDLLEHYREELPVADILRTWNHGSVIRSWLIELMEQQYRAQDGLENVPGYVEDTGEVNWLVDDAMHMEVPVPVIAQSVMQLLLSRDNVGWESFSEALAALLAYRLGDDALPAHALSDLMREIIDGHPDIALAALADLRAVCERDPAAGRFITPFLYFKGHQGLQAYRLSHALWGAGRTELARYLQSRITATPRAERIKVDALVGVAKHDRGVEIRGGRREEASLRGLRAPDLHRPAPTCGRA